MSSDQTPSGKTAADASGAGKENAERKTVTLADLRKPRSVVAPNMGDSSGSAYEAQIETRQQSERLSDVRDPQEIQSDAKAVGLDKYIYLRLPKASGLALRLHAVSEGKKVTTMVEGIVTQYLKDKNLI
jgi:hypothetical protein